MSNYIEYENESIIIPTNTIQKLFEYKNGADLVALYMFYHKQCKMQKTNQSFTTSNFAKKGLGWGDKRFKDAKRILKNDLGLIEDITDKDEYGKIQGWYVKITYIKSKTQENAKLSSSAKTDPLDLSTPGQGNTNAGSTKTGNAGNIKTKNGDLQKKFEQFWDIYPLGKDKKKCYDIYSKLLKNGEKHEKIIEAVKKYRNEIKIKELKGEFAPKFKHPKTWLNNRCWEDEYKDITYEDLKIAFVNCKEQGYTEYLKTIRKMIGEDKYIKLEGDFLTGKI